MAYVPQVVQEAATAPPPTEEEIPPPPPAEAAPPAYVPQVVQEAQSAPAPASTPAPEAAPVAPAPAPSPIQEAANTVGTFLQEQVATPASQFVPQVVKDEVGPRASGAVGAVGQVGQAGAQMADAAVNLDPAGVVTPLLELANQPFAQTAAGQGARAVDPNRGQVPSVSEVIADPSQAMQVIPGWWNTEGPGSWAAGGSLEEYAQAHPEIPAEQVYESWKQEAGLENIPAGVVNPLDEANVGEAAAAIPEFVGSVKDSASQGRLGPFLKAQLVDLGNDPTIPAQIGLAALSGGTSLVGQAAGRAGLSGVESVARGLTTAGRATNRAANAALDPTATAAEVLKPAARGVKNLAGLTDKSAASRATNLAEQDYELATRYLPELRQPTAPAPSLPPVASNTLFNPQPGTAPRPLETAGRADPFLRGAENLQKTPAGVTNPRTGQPLTAPSSTPTRRADRDSLGVQGGVWRTARGQDVVRNNTIDPAHLGTTRRVYDEMLTTPPETFWENFPTSHPKGDVPAEAADGFYARWRAAMRQGLWLLDDWSEGRVRRQFPDAARPDGTVDWEHLSRRATDGDTSARRAMAGKRAHDLYVHRIAGAADPDREVYNLVATYHLDQLSGRFTGPQYGPDYWKQRAEAIGEVLQDAGYTPSPTLLARLNTTSVQTLASADFPQMGSRASDKKMLSQGGVITLHRPGGVTPLTPQPRAARDPNPLPSTSYGGLSIAQRQRAQAQFSETRTYGGATPQNQFRHALAGEPFNPAQHAIDLQNFKSAARDPELQQRLRAQLDGLGLSDVGVRVVDSIHDFYLREFGDPNGAIASYGMYDKIRNLITIQRTLPDADWMRVPEEQFRQVLDHEAIHAMRSMGLFTKAEWHALKFETGNIKAFDGTQSLWHAAADEYQHFNSGQVIDEEAVAQLFAYWRSGGRVTPQTRSIIQKAFDFLRGLVEAIKGTRIEPILRDIDAGVIGGRERGRTTPGGAPGSLVYQQRLAATPNTASRAMHVDPLDAAALDEVREFRFANGSKETLPLREVLTKLRSEAEQWVDMARDPSLQTGRGAAKWASLSKKFGDDGSLDPTTLRPAQVDELVALRLVEAGERVLPTKGPKSGLAQAYQSMLAFNRGARLFNILNIPRYVLQNLFGNTAANVIAGRPRAALRLFSDLGQKADTLKHLRNPGKHSSMAEDMMRATGLGVDRSITQTNRAMLDLAPSGAVRQGRIADIIMPQWQKDLAQVVDVSHRTGLYEETLLAGYRRLNQDLARGVKEWNGKYGLPYSDRQLDEVVGDFLAERRTLIDGITGEPHTGLTGRTDRYEPIWSSQEFNDYLRQRLTAIAPPTSIVADDPLGLLLRRVGADNTASIRAIRAAAKAEVERVAFDWKNTNLDELLSNVFLYHFWNSRAGLLYAKQGLKNPAMLAAYGRMMEDFQTQIDLFDGPDWLKGWFQFLDTPAGYSIWFSPFDLLGSMLTFADWQMDSGDNPFNDLTGLGQHREKTPWMPNPLLDGLLYSLGLYGPDARAPDVLGLGRMWTLGTTLLNEANFEGAIPWANALGIGVDAQGNRVPLKLKGLDELYARFANGLSAAVSPITGLRPVAIPNGDASAQRTDQMLLDQNLRIANPGMPEDQIQERITQALMDPGSPEMQEAWGQRVDLQLTTGSPLGIDLPGPLQAALRLASPVPIYAAPEQAMRGGTLKALPAYQAATVPPPTGEGAQYANLNNAKTLEARLLDEQAYAGQPSGGDPRMDEINQTGYAIYKGTTKEPLTVYGTEYTPEAVAAMSEDQRRDLQNLYYEEHGTNWQEVRAYYEAIPDNAAVNPEGQAYWDWKNAAEEHPGGMAGYVDEQIATNPAYADYIQRNNFSLGSQQIDYEHALSTSAYLAAQGIRPTVWEPISAPVGGPPEAAAPKPRVTPVDDLGEEGLTLRQSPESSGAALANISPGVPMTSLEQRGDWMRVAVADDTGEGPVLEGWVPVAFLANLPTQASGLNAVGMGLVGGLQQGGGEVVGSLLDAAGSVVGSMVGGGQALGTGSKPAATGQFRVEPAPDGFGVRSTADSDRTWMEEMVGAHNAIVTSDYKGPPPAGVSYEYQTGHDADGTTHAAYDISCDTGYRTDGSSTCPGTPITAPVAGRVVCAGYGQGTGEALGSPACTYSQQTTHATNEKGEPSAHTVVLDVGTDAAGNALQLSFNHMGSSTLQPGQQVNPGDLLGGMGDTDGGPHIHLEAWGECNGTYSIIDPALVVGGYYRTHSVC
jgi:hypothetical protein